MLNNTSLVFEKVSNQLRKNENILKMSAQSNIQAGIYDAVVISLSLDVLFWVHEFTYST